VAPPPCREKTGCRAGAGTGQCLSAPAGHQNASASLQQGHFRCIRDFPTAVSSGLQLHEDRAASADDWTVERDAGEATGLLCIEACCAEWHCASTRFGDSLVHSATLQT